jgi:hypothetical protein
VRKIDNFKSSSLHSVPPFLYFLPIFTMYSVCFSQFQHASQTPETFSATYSSYNEIMDAVIQYFNECKGRYPNEVLTHSHTRISYTFADLPFILKSLESQIECGEDHHIHLELDGSTNFGFPILQTVYICIPDRVAARNMAKAEECRERHGGAICYCGCDDCDWDCGTLECGCIDRCKGCCVNWRRHLTNRIQ